MNNNIPIRKGWLLLVAVIVWPVWAMAQPVLRGRVTDKERGVPLAGATVQVLPTGGQVVTDSSGHFAIAVQDTVALLRVSYTGYVVYTAKVDSRVWQPVVLMEQATTLDAVVVSTGYQQLPKERSTGSFAQVSQALLERQAGPGLLSRLEGVTSGLYVSKNGSAGSALVIRGVSTLSAGMQSPLIVVDQQPYAGDIQQLNPNDVASVTVLKDAAAASIWGSRAANGVIVITTKRGAFEQPLRVEATAGVIVGERPDVRRLPWLDSRSFIDVERWLFERGHYDADLSDQFFRPVVSPAVELLARHRAGGLDNAALEDGLLKLTGGAFLAEAHRYLYQRMVQQQYAVSMSGGGKQQSYRLSVGYDKERANLVGNGQERVTFQSQYQLRPWKGGLIQAGITGTQTAVQYNSEGGVQAMSAGGGKSVYYPYARLREEDGSAAALPREFRQAYTDTAGGGRLLDWAYRPLEELEFLDRRSVQQHALLQLSVRQVLAKGLQAQWQYQLERGVQLSEELQGMESFGARQLVNIYSQLLPTGIRYGVPKGGIMDHYQRQLAVQGNRLQLEYQGEEGPHQWQVLGAGEWRSSATELRQWRDYGYDVRSRNGRPVDYVNAVATYDGLYGTAMVPYVQSGSRGLQRTVSVLMNGAYTYRRKYVLSVSARRDAANLFGVQTNERWVPLWSVGSSWQLSREAFYRWDWLPQLKLRLTYGYGGNADANASALATLNLLQAASNFVPVPSATIRTAPNGALRWERVGTLNAGVDMGLRGGRLQGSIEYYVKRSTDLLTTVPVDPTTGFTTAPLNTGRMRVRGMDVQLTGVPVDGVLRLETDVLLQWQQALILEQYRQVSASLLVGTELGVNGRQGYAPYGIYSYRWMGLNAGTGAPVGMYDGKLSEDYRAITQQTLPDSLQYHGSGRPAWFGTLRQTLRYKGWSLSVLLQAQWGFSFRAASIQYSNLYNYWIGHQDYLRRWQQPGDELHTYVPAAYYPGNIYRDNFYAGAEVHVLPGAHIRCQDVRLGYDLPKGMNRVMQGQVYVLVNQPGLLWKANDRGLDPSSSNGLPQPVSVAVGVRFGW